MDAHERKRKDIVGDISLEMMYNHVEKLYVHKEIEGMPEIKNEVEIEKLFDDRIVAKGLKKMANGKAHDMLNFSAEMLKWSDPIARQ